MSDRLKKIEDEILGLTDQERAFPADRLLSSLGETIASDLDPDWLVEAERRYKEYKSGKREGFPAADVFDDVDRMLR